MRIIFFYLVSLSFFSIVRAQQGENQSSSSSSSAADIKSDDDVLLSAEPQGEPEVIYQKKNQPKLNIDKLREDFEPPPKETEIPLPLSLEHWTRFTGGLWFSYGTIGIAQPVFKITQDKFLMKNATERVWGFGGQLDFAMAEDAEQGLRTRFGILRSTITPQSDLSKQYPRASYETQANIFHISAIQRWHMGASSMSGHMWLGVGGQLNYALSTSRNNKNATPRSKLSNSYSFNLIGALGTDIPMTDLEDITIEFQYLPPRGVVALIGFRSSL